jgi:hypothetical protein
MTSAEPGGFSWRADEDDPFAGAGIFSSYADLGGALAAGQDPGAIMANSVAAGLDALGAVTDPFGTLFAAGVGWAVEHVAFLREPLDALMGDPDGIVASADSWHRLAAVLAEQSARYSAHLGADLGGWSGEAADAYRASAARRIDDLAAASSVASGLAQDVLRNAAEIGALRSVVRDTVASFLARVAEWLVVSIISAGAALTVAVPSMVAQAVSLALRIADRIGALMRTLNRGAAGVRAVTAELTALVEQMPRVGDDVLPAPVGLPASALPGAWPTIAAAEEMPGVPLAVEAGKEGGDEREHRREWVEEPAGRGSGPVG